MCLARQYLQNLDGGLVKVVCKSNTQKRQLCVGLDQLLAYSHFRACYACQVHGEYRVGRYGWSHTAGPRE